MNGNSTSIDIIFTFEHSFKIVDIKLVFCLMVCFTSDHKFEHTVYLRSLGASINTQYCRPLMLSYYIHLAYCDSKKIDHLMGNGNRTQDLLILRPRPLNPKFGVY